MSSGVYAAVKWDQKSTSILKAIIDKHNIPNPVPDEKIHTTLIYSKIYDDITDMISNPVYHKAVLYDFDVWDTQDGKKALVGLLYSPELVQKHQDIMRTKKLTYDYPEYKAHITLSYDVGPDFDISSIDKTFSLLYTTHEYTEELQLDWAKKE